jgi:hypothetical protein
MFLQKDNWTRAATAEMFWLALTAGIVGVSVAVPVAVMPVRAFWDDPDSSLLDWISS